MIHPNSIAAADSIDISARCLAALAVYVATIQPLTDAEAGDKLGWPITSIRPRVSNLVALGLVEEIASVHEKGARSRVRCCGPTALGRKRYESLNHTHA